MDVLAFPPRVHPVTAQALRDLEGACADVRQAIDDAETVAEAYQLWEHCNLMTRLLMRLTDEASTKCNRLSEEH